MKKILLILLSLLFASSMFATLTDAEAYYSFDDTTKDESFWTNNGASLTTGKIDGAMDFDGSNDYININNPYVVGTNDISVSLWLNLDSLADDQVFIFNRDGGTSDNRFFLRTTNSGKVGVYTQAGGSGVIFESSSTLSIGTWYHITFTRTGSSGEIFINGVSDATGTVEAGNIGQSGHDWTLGTLSGGNFLNGQLDDVAIYERVLTTQEITDMYNSGTGKKANEVANDFEFYSSMDFVPTTYDVFGATGSQGLIDSAMDFDGSNDYIDTNKNFNTDIQTVSLWFNADDVTTNQLLVSGGNAGGGSFLDLQLVSGNLRGLIRVGGVDRVVSFPVSTSTWYQTILTYNDLTKELDLYVNGNLEDSLTASGSKATTEYDVVIGARASATGLYYNGQLDDVAIYDRVLTTQEITDMYNSGVGKKANEVADDTTFYAPMDSLSDSTGNLNYVQGLNGVTYQDGGKLRGAYDFDGSNDYIGLNNFGISTTDSFTESMWIKVGSFGGSETTILDLRGDVNHDITLESNGKLRGSYYDGTTYILDSTTVLSIGVWYNLIITSDGGTAKLYLNGVEENSISYGLTSTPQNNRLGSQYNDLEYFDGQIDEVAIYNRALTSQEITELYNNGEGFNPYAPIGGSITLSSIKANNETFVSDTVFKVSDITFDLELNNVSTNANINTTATLYNDLTKVKLSEITINNTLTPSFAFTGLSELPYEVSFYSFNNETNTTFGNFSFSIDLTPPSIDNNMPNKTNDYLFNVSQYANCQNIGTGVCQITFLPDNQTVNLPYVNDATQFSSVNQSHSIVAQDSTPEDIYFNGTHWYVVGSATDKVYLYDNSFTYTGTSFDVSTEDTEPTGVYSDGSFFYITGSNTKKVYKYDDSFTYTGTSFDVATEDTLPRGLYFKDSLWYVVGNQNKRVYAYDGNFSYTGISYDVSQATTPQDTYYDGRFWYVPDGASGNVYQYTSDFIYEGTSFNPVGDSNPRGLYQLNDKWYLAGNSNDVIVEYNSYRTYLDYNFTYNGNQSYTIYTNDTAGNELTENGTIFVNPYAYFNFQYENGTAIKNYTLNGFSFEDQANFTIYNSELQLGNNTLEFAKLGFATTNISFVLTNTSRFNQTYNISESNIIIKVYDRDTRNLIVVDNITLTLIGTTGFQGSTITGQLNITDINLINERYQLIATTDNYETETVFFTYDNQKNLAVNVYMLSSTNPDIGVINVDVKNNGAAFVEGALVKLLEWIPSSNAFISVAEATTNANGRAQLNLELGVKLYKIQASDGTTTSLTDSEIIYSSGELRTIVLSGLDTSTPPLFKNLDYNITEFEPTDTSRVTFFYWNDKNNLVYEGCIKAYKVNEAGKKEIIDSLTQCAEGSTGTLQTDEFSINNSFTMVVEVTLTADGKQQIFKSFNYAGTGSLNTAFKFWGINLVLPLALFLLGFALGIALGFVSLGTLLSVVGAWIGAYLASDTLSYNIAGILTVFALLAIWAGGKRK